jgi:hypothetical protein
MYVRIRALCARVYHLIDRSNARREFCLAINACSNMKSAQTCVCIYIYIYIYICTHIYIYIHTHIYRHTHTNSPCCQCVQKHEKCTFRHIYIHIYVDIQTQFTLLSMRAAIGRVSKKSFVRSQIRRPSSSPKIDVHCVMYHAMYVCMYL